ncbi:MAG: hypothetical protein QOE30_4346 [Mycobacterium sp.]|jgi:hypothetical protein|nr:hypothetical protein [Mycobacterium sp.]
MNFTSLVRSSTSEGNFIGAISSVAPFAWAISVSVA